MGKVKALLTSMFFLGALGLKAQTVIKKVIYQEVEQTKVQVIQREMPFKLGDTLFDLNQKLFEFENRIVSLGLFTRVDLSMINDTTLRIKALEKIYIWGLPKIELADPNFSQWWQSKDFSRIAVGADVYAKNLGGLKNQLTFSALAGFNSFGSIQYKKVPQGTKWNQGFFVQLGMGFRSQQKIGVNNDKLVWENRNSPYLNYKQINAGINWRANLYNFVGLSATAQFIRSKPNVAIISPFSPKDSIVNMYAIAGEYTYDRRIQQHFPVGGFFFKSKIHLKNVKGNESSWLIPEVNIKANKYHRFNKRWLVKAGMVGTYQFNTSPFYYSAGLGLDRDYVRGYEPYTFLGNGYVLGKMSLAYGLVRNKKVKLSNKRWAKNYGTMPFSLWCSIFAESGRLIEPVVKGNTMVNENLYSIGLSVQALAYYNSTIRVDMAINRLNNAVGNISFRNAF